MPSSSGSSSPRSVPSVHFLVTFIVLPPSARSTKQSLSTRSRKISYPVVSTTVTETSSQCQSVPRTAQTLSSPELTVLITRNTTDAVNIRSNTLHCALCLNTSVHTSDYVQGTVRSRTDAYFDRTLIVPWSYFDRTHSVNRAEAASVKNVYKKWPHDVLMSQSSAQ
jgi:hypothetical protein